LTQSKPSVVLTKCAHITQEIECFLKTLIIYKNTFVTPFSFGFGFLQPKAWDWMSGMLQC